MSKLFSPLHVIALVALLGSLIAPVHAQFATDEMNDVRTALFESSEALGSVRGADSGVIRAVLRVRYLANGTINEPQEGGEWAEHQVDELAMEMHYGIPAMRADYQLVNEDREIHVVNGEHTWYETTPGMGASPSDDDADRWIWEIWSTPHGALWAALDAEAADPSSIELMERDGKRVLAFSKDDIPMEITLGENDRPESVQLTINHPVLGETVVVTHFMDYQNWELLDVFFPERIVRTMNDQEVMDLTVTGYRTNPYVVFPIPENI